MFLLRKSPSQCGESLPILLNNNALLRTKILGTAMPKSISKIAYVLLIVLMFGVASGWLGAA